MVLYLLKFTLLLASASALLSPNNAPTLRANFGSYNPNAFLPSSDSTFRNGVSLSAAVGIESEVIASIFAATVGYIMLQDTADIVKAKKEKRANKTTEAQINQEVILAPVESELEEITEDIKVDVVDTHELEPEVVLEKDTVESDDQEKSMEPSTDLNDAKESEVVSIDDGEPAGTIEPPSTPISTIEVENSVEMGKNEQAAGKSIFDVKKSIASTLKGERERVDRLEATSETESSAEQIETVEIEEDVIEVPEPVSGRKRKFAKKSVKKILMPWKKWSSL